MTTATVPDPRTDAEREANEVSLVEFDIPNKKKVT
jgi:hypothetical protein